MDVRWLTFDAVAMVHEDAQGKDYPKAVTVHAAVVDGTIKIEFFEEKEPSTT